MVASMVVPALLGTAPINVQGTVAIDNDTSGNVAVAVFDDTGVLVGLTNTTDTGEFQTFLSNNTPGRYKVIAISDDAYGGVYKWYAPAPIWSALPGQNITVSI